MIAADILLDGFFAAVAAVGFGAVSDPPMRAFPRIALLAAVAGALGAAFFYLRRREEELDEYEQLLFSEDYSEEMGEMPEQAAEEPAGEE